jgi:hypothetical protein
MKVVATTSKNLTTPDLEGLFILMKVPFMIYNLIMMHSCTSSSVLYNAKTTSELEIDAMLMLMLISLYIDVVDIAVAVDVEDN